MSVPLSPFSKYLTASDQDKRWRIFCIDAGCTEIRPGELYPPRPESHPPQYSRNWERGRVLHEFQIIYVTGGRGRFKSAGGLSRSIEAGTVIMLFPGVWHWFSPSRETGWDEYWVGFDGSYPHSLVKEGFFSPREPVFQVGLHDSLLQSFLDIVGLVQREPPGYQLEAGAAVLQIMARILAMTRQQRQSSEAERVVQKAKCVFEENKHGVVDMESLARSLGLEYPRFRQIFKDYTGLPPYQYFLQVKINRAKSLLQDEGYSVKQVAHMLSFDNPCYFSRLFKKKTGVAPSSWQRVDPVA
ncbi:MAG: AraC family transcriptional regulator [Spirochaetales bacterium]|nr:AraC family transcriptional regulator [Spirochaetales bacterium]